MKIILAQGNPEPDYSNTRHNVGFSILNSFANKLGVNWLNSSKFHAIIAETELNGERVVLVKPTTFYNETGLSARKLIDFYKLDPSKDLLVIHDDLSLPFGTIRIRQKGSDAGNNGIKSLNSHLGDSYTRIRIGINHDAHELVNDADFVLSKFSTTESEQLTEKITPQVVEMVNQFAALGLQPTSQQA